jgi:hypothetical protein
LALFAVAAVCFLLVGCVDARRAVRYQAGQSTRDMAAQTIMERVDRYDPKPVR